MQTNPTEVIPSQLPGERKWYEIWWDIWRHPREEAFQALLKERDHSRRRAFTWVFITSFILSGYIALFILPRVLNTLSRGEFSRYNPGAQLIIGASTIIFSTVLAIVGLLIITGLLHVVAPAFSGYGELQDLAICISAIIAPYSILGTIFSSLDIFIIQRTGIRLITIVLFLALGFYAIILLVNALKAAENLPTGSAVATLLVPGVIISVIGLCCSGQFITTLMGGG